MLSGHRASLPTNYPLSFLCLYCLFAMAPWLGLKTVNCTREGIEEVDKIRSYITGLKDAADCKLYTPRVHDYENCPITTLSCFVKEFKVLVFDLELHKTNLTKPLDRRLNILNQKQWQKDREGCPQCEVYEEKTAEAFLKDLQSILQYIHYNG
ncbi:interleukin 15, like isoform X2 [Amia ocellicauda]|uniref:interleukin 15, like isoform X2 n=1 Tax=Amia ocellicauda TaxID=2972642 RepID=UPI003463A5D6